MLILTGKTIDLGRVKAKYLAFKQKSYNWFNYLTHASWFGTHLCIVSLPLANPFLSLLTLKLQSPVVSWRFHKTQINYFQMTNSSGFIMIARTSGNADILAPSLSGSSSFRSLPAKIPHFAHQGTARTQEVLLRLPQKQAE